MDTDWFALDEQGHIAKFGSGETGSVPKAYLDAFDIQTSIGDVLDRFPRDENGRILVGGDREMVIADTSLDNLWRLVEKTEQQAGKFLCNVGHLEGERQVWKPVYAPTVATATVWYAIIVVESESVTDELDFQGEIIVFGDQGDTFGLARCSLQSLLDASNDGTLLGFRKANLGDETLRALGFFAYKEGDLKDGATCPYKRTYAPKKPVRIDQIPEQARSMLSIVRFDKVSFEDAQVIQPPAHVESSSVQEAWVSYGGEIMPFEDE
jgi:hypothetical protein